MTTSFRCTLRPSHFRTNSGEWSVSDILEEMATGCRFTYIYTEVSFGILEYGYAIFRSLTISCQQLVQTAAISVIPRFRIYSGEWSVSDILEEMATGCRLTHSCTEVSFGILEYGYAIFRS